MKTIILSLLFATATTFSANANDAGGNPKSSDKISKWVSEHISYPQDAITNREEGTVYVAFTVVDGKITEIEVVESAGELLDKAAVATVQTAPVAELGVNPNENKTYILPIKFELK